MSVFGTATVSFLATSVSCQIDEVRHAFVSLVLSDWKVSLPENCLAIWTRKRVTQSPWRGGVTSLLETRGESWVNTPTQNLADRKHTNRSLTWGKDFPQGGTLDEKQSCQTGGLFFLVNGSVLVAETTLLGNLKMQWRRETVADLVSLALCEVCWKPRFKERTIFCVVLFGARMTWGEKVGECRNLGTRVGPERAKPGKRSTNDCSGLF